jgi:hypothetical protein
MSQRPTTTAASRFRAIFDTALMSYKQQTKKDLIAHPLAPQLQGCSSTSDIIAILQEQVQHFDYSRSGDERLTKWFPLTVNVLSAYLFL